jgi:hypothetical protein
MADCGNTSLRCHGPCRHPVVTARTAAWLLDERAWLKSQAFLLLRQGATEVALQRFQYLALPIIELLAHG